MRKIDKKKKKKRKTFFKYFSLSSEAFCFTERDFFFFKWERKIAKVCCNRFFCWISALCWRRISHTWKGTGVVRNTPVSCLNTSSVLLQSFTTTTELSLVYSSGTETSVETSYFYKQCLQQVSFSKNHNTELQNTFRWRSNSVPYCLSFSFLILLKIRPLDVWVWSQSFCTWHVCLCSAIRISPFND